MKPYILTRKDEELFKIYSGIMCLVITVLATPILDRGTIVYGYIMSAIYIVIFTYWYISVDRKHENYNALVINEEGIECADDKYIYFMPWDEIDKVTLKIKKNKGRMLVMTMTDDDEIEFCLTPYRDWMSVKKLRRAIRYFSGREDIFIILNRFWWLY